MITVSRKEVEALLTQLNITHQDLRALLDKAEVSEAVAIPTAPEKIWLNIGDTDLAEIKENNWQWNELSEITWCQDKIDQCDIPYIRADLVYTAPPNQSAKIAELEESNSNLKSQWMYYQDLLSLNGFDGIADCIHVNKKLQKQVTELEAEIARLKAIIEDMKVIDNVFWKGK